MKKFFIKLTVLLILSTSLTSCQPDIGLDGIKGPGTEDAGTGMNKSIEDIMDKGPVKGGVLNIFTTVPDTLNPILTKNLYVCDFLSFIYEGLVKLDEKQQPQPLLSDAWSVTSDGLVWTFHIREGVSWQDGSPLTAEDVEFTISSILNNKVDSVYKKSLQNITTFAAVDSSNFKIVLRKPNSFLPEIMTFPIIPRHQFDQNDIMSASNGFKPVGTGPYEFSTYEEGKKVVMVSNKSWWYLKTQEDNAANMMYIDEIDAKIYKEPDDAMNAFQIGDIDVAFVNSSDFIKYKGRTDLIIKKYISRDYDFLSFNLYNPVFNDLSVRQVVESAIDRNAIIKDILQEGAIKSDIPVLPTNWLFDGSVSTAKNIINTRDVLINGGWKESESGYYKRFNGIRKNLDFELLVNDNNLLRLKVAEKICEQLKSAGINATVVKIPLNELFARIDAKKFDLALMGCRVTQIPDISFLYSNTYLPSFLPVQDNIGRNVSGYSNPDVSSYMERIFKENDSSTKKALYINMKQIIDQDIPYIGLYFLNNAVIYRKNVRGYLNPYTWDRYFDITKWYIPDLQ